MIDPKTRKKMHDISKISLNHIAITPLYKAINQETSVALRKSLKDEEILCFDNYEDFIKSFIEVDSLKKAMVAGSATNIAGISGGQALQKQSLEGKKVDAIKIKHALPFILDNILNKSNNLYTTRHYMDYLTKKGFNEYEAMETILLLAKNGAKIVELFI
jgi:hypothetical protein